MEKYSCSCMFLMYAYYDEQYCSYLERTTLHPLCDRAVLGAKSRSLRP